MASEFRCILCYRPIKAKNHAEYANLMCLCSWCAKKEELVSRKAKVIARAQEQARAKARAEFKWDSDLSF